MSIHIQPPRSEPSLRFPPCARRAERKKLEEEKEPAAEARCVCVGRPGDDRRAAREARGVRVDRLLFSKRAEAGQETGGIVGAHEEFDLQVARARVRAHGPVS